MQPKPEISEHVIINRWIDGDTFEALYRADVSLPAEIILPWMPGRKIGLTLSGEAQVSVIVRCDGMNAPESHGPTAQAGLAARAFAETICPAGTFVELVTAKRAEEKYGRWLARVILTDGSDFAAKMIGAGHATEYHGEKRS